MQGDFLLRVLHPPGHGHRTLVSVSGRTQNQALPCSSAGRCPQQDASKNAGQASVLPTNPRVWSQKCPR